MRDLPRSARTHASLRRRRLGASAFVAGALLVAACASDPSTVDLPPGSTSTSAPAGIALPGPTTSTSTRSTSTQRLPPASRSTVETTAPAGVGRLGAPGSNAPRYLRATPARSIRVQVLVEPGAEPRQATIDKLVSVLRSVSGKPVSTSGGGLPRSGGRSWTADALVSTAAERAPSLAADVALLQVLYVTGSYGGDTSVLGISVNAGVSAIFEDQVSATATGLVGPDRIELAVSTHEVGHLLGLVDLYLHTGRADRAHPGHSTNPRSVMYWAVESDVVTDLLTGGPPVDFDAADLADLSAIRGG